MPEAKSSVQARSCWKLKQWIAPGRISSEFTKSVMSVVAYMAAMARCCNLDFQGTAADCACLWCSTCPYPRQNWMPRVPPCKFRIAVVSRAWSTTVYWIKLTQVFSLLLQGEEEEKPVAVQFWIAADPVTTVEELGAVDILIRQLKDIFLKLQLLAVAPRGSLQARDRWKSCLVGWLWYITRIWRLYESHLGTLWVWHQQGGSPLQEFGAHPHSGCGWSSCGYSTTCLCSSITWAYLQNTLGVKEPRAPNQGVVAFVVFDESVGMI